MALSYLPPVLLLSLNNPLPSTIPLVALCFPASPLSNCDPSKLSEFLSKACFHANNTVRSAFEPPPGLRPLSRAAPARLHVST